MRMKGKKPVFGYKDTFSMDETLRPIISEGIKKFKEVCVDGECVAGFPGRLYADFGYEIHSDDRTDEQDDEVHNILYAKWHEILDKMIWAFDHYDADEELDHEEFGLRYEVKELTDPEGNTVTRFGPNTEEAFNAYSKAIEEHEAKVQEGIDLFAKYFKCLWW